MVSNLKGGKNNGLANHRFRVCIKQSCVLIRTHELYATSLLYRKKNLYLSHS